MNNNSRKHFIIWASVLALSAIIEFSLGPVEEYLLRLSPISIWKLPERAGYAIVATVIASLVAWLSALAVGGILGLFTAAGELAAQKKGKPWKVWHATANGIRRTFTALYVIPLVLTLSVIGTVLLKLEIENTLNGGMVGVLLVIASGITLAGQRIYIALDDAVRTASSDDLMIASSLYLGQERYRYAWVGEITRLWKEARFLIGCRISLLMQAVEQAFHLAVVGVVILETTSVVPYIYEKLFPQEAKVLEWGGGIGRVIIDGQNATNPELVAGAVWLILIIDSFIAWGIREYSYSRWVHPYRSR